MNHLPPLIYDLAIILAAAAFSTLLFSRLRQPIVLGYLIAGFLVGPHFPWSPSVVDTESVKVWAEIGVIFLLFGLGLEFSFKKLAQVGRSASISAIFEIITMMSVGYFFGQLFGWTKMDSIFLGAILSMSSTTIIIRAFDEAGIKGRGFVNLVFGILIVEDLMAILLMVLLGAISVPGAFSGSNLLFLSGRLAFFLLLWFLLGIYILPTFLAKIRSYLTSEIMLVVSIGLCLIMVVLATKAGFSAALGAFIMGAILSETHEGERIEHLLLPVKDLFAAVFFVSVGMMIDPSVLREHWAVVLLITLITIIGKLIGSGFGALLSGRSLKQSVQAGMSLAQIGEFSFIIATLGMTLNVTSDFLYPIIIAVSAVTTFTTPYMIRYSGPIYEWIERRLPKAFIDRLRDYEVAMSVDLKEGALRLLGRIYGFPILLNAVVIIAFTMGISKIAVPALETALGKPFEVQIVACMTALIVCSPFLWAIVLKMPSKLSAEAAITVERLGRMQLGVIFVRILIAIGLVAFIVNQFASARFFAIFVIATVFSVLFFLRKGIENFYLGVERRFLNNLNAKEMAEAKVLDRNSKLTPWDATLAHFVVSSNSEFAGQTLEEVNFRGTTGATIAMIQRGHKRIVAPGAFDQILPNDHIYLIGTDEQVSVAQELLEGQGVPVPTEQDELFSLESLALDTTSPYISKSIRDCGLREKIDGLIVGIERAGQRILNPDSSMVLEANDLLWIVGYPDKISKLRKQRV